jgi:F0F1-type ATP synthase assembly protein I
MVLPSVVAILVDYWLGSLPFITIVVILICFPTATILVTKKALREMDRVIAEVTPPLPLEEALPETELEVESS